MRFLSWGKVGHPAGTACTAAMIAASCFTLLANPAATLAKTSTAVTAARSPGSDLQALPNELGRIPILMYHQIGGRMPKKDHGLVRTIADFRQDLEQLYALGFRPVTMKEILTGRIDVPAGMSPVVLTFDDGRESQFRLIRHGKSLTIDPNCAVAILEAFHRKHPDWQQKATFFVLPKSKYTADTFCQSGLGKWKLQYLVDHGYEIGNHTLTHHSMGPMTPAQIQAEVGAADAEILASTPEARITVLALPMGVYPRDRSHWKYLVSGSYAGHAYHYRGAMLAAFQPIPSPADKAFNPLRMQRISAMNRDPNGSRGWIKRLMAPGGNRYISDGDPNIVSYPKAAEGRVNQSLLRAQGLTAHAYALPDKKPIPVVRKTAR